MNIGIGQATPPGNTVFKRIHWARKYGFDAFELFCSPVPAQFCGVYAPDLPFAAIKELKDELAGFSSVTLHAPFQNVFDTSLVSVNPKLREASVQDILFTIRLAEAVGGSVVTCHSGWTSSQADPKQVQANLIASLRQLSAEAGAVRVAVEVADWFLPLENCELLRELALPNVGITLDIGHAHFPVAGKPAYAAFGSVAEFVRQFGDLILSLHVHDFDGEADHIELGKGHIDLAGIIAALLEVGYAGDLTLELNPDLCGPESILRSKRVLEELLGGEVRLPLETDAPPL